MAKEVMTRTASQNTYLHKDFHGALSVGLIYVQEHFGDDAVREYLRDFATAFYSPLTASIRERGLIALKEHFEKIYNLEGGDVSIRYANDELVIDVKACPAVTHMREHNYLVSPLFHETTRTVNEVICDGTPVAFEMLSYDEQTGQRVERFYRRLK
jgi:hypothetical protein